MKKIVLMITFFNGFLCFGQDASMINTFNPNQWNKLLVGKEIIPDNNENIYPIKDYVEAKVTGFKEVFSLRYNASNDRFEFENENGELYDIINQDGTLISFKDGRRYLYTNYFVNGENKIGYLQILTDPLKDKILFKKLQITKIEVEKNGYNLNKDLKFYKDENFFITTKDRIEQVPLTSKNLDNLFEENLTDIIKSNRLDVSKETDLVKLVGLLNK